MKKFKVGVQLYSVRDAMEKDFYGTLKKVADAGYEHVEFAGYFGHSAEEVRAMLDELGLYCASVHQGIELFLREGKAAVDYLKTIGAKYAAIPSYGIEHFRKDFGGTVEMFRGVSDLLAEGGIRLTYHNHDFEFEKIDGEYILDKIYAACEGKLEGEVDTCWVSYAGVDPAKYILGYKGKMKTLHLKDYKCKGKAGAPVYALIDENGNARRASKEENGFRFTPLGQGVQDLASILAAAEEVGIDYVIVEQDDTYEIPSVEAIKISRDYLKNTFGI